MKVLSRIISVCMAFTLFLSVMSVMPAEVTEEPSNFPDVDQVSASWPLVFEEK